MNRVLLVHNFYRQRGGEDAVFAAESDLLVNRGHTVREWTADSGSMVPLGGVRVGLQAIWSRKTSHALRDVIDEFRPDVVHFHNTFPFVSPSAYYATRDAGTPVVQTLHNYRFVCPGGTFYRDGEVCEDCLGRLGAWSGMRHGCYHESRLETSAVAAVHSLHRVIGTWERAVDLFISPTIFARSKFLQAGIAPEKIRVKPHFVHPDLGPGEHAGGYALFVGRLSPEKGVETLLAAWEHSTAGVPLRIVGDGPLRSTVAEAAGRIPNVEWLGARSAEDVAHLMGDATLLICPSTCYETFGRVITEAFARGTPVIASAHGALSELIADGTTGFLFPPGDARALASTVERAWSNLETLASMREPCRRQFEDFYSADVNYEQLMDIYREASSCASHGWPELESA